MQIQLSDDFWLNEFTSSQTAERKPEIAGDQFDPPNHVIESLRYLCENTIQPLRTLLATPIRISSGYRSPGLNEAIGGSPNSQHLKGQAADLVISDRILRDPKLARPREVIEHMVYERVGKWLRKDVNANFYLFAAGCLYLNELDVDQIIHEYGTPGQPAWVHISASTERSKRQILKIPKIEGADNSVLSLEEALELGC